MLLHGFMCDQFGYENLREMLNRFDGLQGGFMKDGASRFCRALGIFIHPNTKEATTTDLSRYDANIIAHSQTLGMIEDKNKSWKAFQYLALLFTERYLDLYFQDREILIEKLNEWKERRYSSFGIDDYTANDIHTLAFQSATGSGKTLLLHANILQYRHYMKEYKQLHKLNKIILVTPDEGLSRQHLRELKSSNIPARLFSDNEGADLFSSGGALVDIIDLHKLDEKKGVKRVALESFEENNLVMVDEGHLGTGGTVWRKRRKQLARNGFTFEYSATFNQAVSGSGDEIKKLRDEYGKSILFDYSYKFFYRDGYGKDYKISNLQHSDDGEANDHYLLACLLSFYQQCRIYEDKGAQWREYNIAPPLWVFLGKTVTGGKSAGKRETETDVVRIVNFLAWVASSQSRVVGLITKLISGNTGLVDQNDKDIFKGAFPYISGGEPQNIYDDLCLKVFRGKGQLQLSHLTGMDELQLSAGDEDPFGVINVGDASGLYTKLEAVKNPRFALSKNAFNKPLFADVDSHNSPVNIVIGARKFAAGWNSWRVSTMGLMHVGTGEGPQIIQMFGRGVRLKGYGMSLKRHSAIEGVKPDDAVQLKMLETLNIFGLKANYMDKFKDYLQKEGVKVEWVTFQLPAKKQFGKIKDLKVLKKRDDAGEFQYSDVRLDLPKKPGGKDFVTLDRYGQLQVLQSLIPAHGKEEAKDTKEKHKFGEKHLALINKQSVYHKMLERKRRFQWHNMTISRDAVDALLANNAWYEFHIPREKLNPSDFSRVREWEALAVDLLCEYAGQYWSKARNKWEHEHLEAETLEYDNPNYVERYELSVDAEEDDLINDIKRLVKEVESGEYNEDFETPRIQLSLLTPRFHAYIPLLHVSADKTVQISPATLNEGEAMFVKNLKAIVENEQYYPVLQGKEIYLMRNLSRGKGISFFEYYSFYPDFILWVKDKNSQNQHILFIDPKGLARYDSKVKSKVELHKRIKETQKKIRLKTPELSLHSYVWSHTRAHEIGSDDTHTPNEWRRKGVFFSGDGFVGIKEMLEDALQGK